MATLNPISIATIGYVCQSVINPIARGTHGYVCLGVAPAEVIGGGHGGVIRELQPIDQNQTSDEEQLVLLAVMAIDEVYD